MFRLAAPGAIFAGGAGTGRAGAAAGLPALDVARAATFAAGLRAAGFALRAAGRESFFRAGAGFVFFRAAVGIGCRLSSIKEGRAALSGQDGALRRRAAPTPVQCNT